MKRIEFHLSNLFHFHIFCRPGFPAQGPRKRSGRSSERLRRRGSCARGANSRVGPGISGVRGFPLGRHPERNGTSGRSHSSRTGPVSGPGDPRASNPFDRFGPKVTSLSGHDRRDDRPPGEGIGPGGTLLVARPLSSRRRPFHGPSIRGPKAASRGR
jgi:hypothetical protein